MILLGSIATVWCLPEKIGILPVYTAANLPVNQFGVFSCLETKQDCGMILL
jgi:hypothetical protein